MAKITERVWKVSPSVVVTDLTVPVSVRFDVFQADVGAEAFGLLLQVHHEFRPHDTVGKPGKFSTSVVFIRAPRRHRAGEHQRLQASASGVDRGGVTGGAGADNDDVVCGS